MDIFVRWFLLPLAILLTVANICLYLATPSVQSAKPNKLLELEVRILRLEVESLERKKENLSKQE